VRRGFSRRAFLRGASGAALALPLLAAIIITKAPNLPETAYRSYNSLSGEVIPRDTEPFPVYSQLLRDEAVNYLAGQGQYADRSPNPQPSLILLDVKMPNRDGLAVLTWIRNSVISSNIPVIMLTSSSQQIDVSTAYETGADCYLVKPANLDRFRDLVEDLMKVCWPEPAQPQCLFEVRFPNHSERRAFRKD